MSFRAEVAVALVLLHEGVGPVGQPAPVLTQLSAPRGPVPEPARHETSSTSPHRAFGADRVHDRQTTRDRNGRAASLPNTIAARRRYDDAADTST